MRLLVTGKGTSGSWKIRGEQLGHAIGAEVIPNCTDMSGYDAVILVKRPSKELLAAAKAYKVKLIWDVIDAWPQPEGNMWGRDQCIEWLDLSVSEIKPSAIVTPTHGMSVDCQRFSVPVRCVPHHARPGMYRNPIRHKVKKVGYEGSEVYIQKFGPILEWECTRRGWDFVINPDNLSDVDIVVGMRDQNGYAPSRWKSNVKLANAQGSGTPCIMNREQGYIETACGAEMWADSVKELSDAMDRLGDELTRKLLADKLYASAPRLENVASTYLAWIKGLS